jgi:hypothetical protein
VIDDCLKSYFPLAEAPDHFPRRRGKKVSLPSIYRWVGSGCRGVRLRTVVVGGVRYTSAEALRQFVAEMTSIRDGAAPSRVLAPACPTAISRKLDALGI